MSKPQLLKRKWRRVLTKSVWHCIVIPLAHRALLDRIFKASASMVLSLAASWGDCEGGLAPRVPSLKDLMALPCTMQSCRLMKNCGRAPGLFIRHLCSSMVLSLVASWGDCGGCLAPRVPSFKELMALPCTMQSCHLMKNCRGRGGLAPHKAQGPPGLDWSINTKADVFCMQS